MKKIPVGRTIQSAYRFTFVELEKVIGLIWFPIIVMTVADYFVNGYFLTMKATALESGDASQLQPLAAAQVGYLFLTLVLLGMIAVAIAREILKPLDRPLWLRFSLGGAEFRFVGATLALGAMAALVIVLCMIAGMILSGTVAIPATGMAPGQQAIGLAALIAFVLSPALIYLFVRLGSLVLPSLVMDGGIGLERSWQLLKGNVWRMLLVSLAVGIPVVLVDIALYAAILGPDSFNPHFELAGDHAAMVRHQIEVYRQTAARLPWLEGLEFVLAPFLYGLGFSAPVFAYKALVAGGGETNGG